MLNLGSTPQSMKTHLSPEDDNTDQPCSIICLGLRLLASDRAPTEQHIEILSRRVIIHPNLCLPPKASARPSRFPIRYRASLSRAFYPDRHSQAE